MDLRSYKVKSLKSFNEFRFLPVYSMLHPNGELHLYGYKEGALGWSQVLFNQADLTDIREDEYIEFDLKKESGVEARFENRRYHILAYGSPKGWEEMSNNFKQLHHGV